MTNRIQYLCLSFIILVAAVFRFSNIDWDGYNHYHPDERYITWVATSIEWPEDWSNALNPRKSTFNPFYWPANANTAGVALEQDQQRRFAYGHLPLYIGVSATRLVERWGPVVATRLPEDWLLTTDILNSSGWNEFRHITAVGRTVTALIDLATIVVLFHLGKVLQGPNTGLLAAAFLSVNVMHIQLAHFFTVDPYLTLFTVLAITLMTKAVKSRQNTRQTAWYILLSGLIIGLAVGSKFTAVLLFLPLVMTVLFLPKISGRQKLFLLVASVGLGFLVFVMTNPFAIIDSTCDEISGIGIGPIHIPDQLNRSCYLYNVSLQGSMVQGLRDVPFVRQYIDTVPFLYFAEMQIRWGMGLFLGIIGFAGFFWSIKRGILVLNNNRKQFRSTKTGARLGEWLSTIGSTEKAEIIILLWTVPFFLTTGSLDVKFMRYIQPLSPFLMLYAASLLLSLRSVHLRTAVSTICLAATALYATAFLGMYQQPHPWISASKWIFQNIDSGSRIVSEVWDDRLPDNVLIEGTYQSRNKYIMSDVNWLSGIDMKDSDAKLADNLSTIAKADYLVMASNRNYGVIPRIEERYPLSSQYYRLLFTGDLGFEVVYTKLRAPNIQGFHLIPEYFSWPDVDPPLEVKAYLDDLRGISWGRTDESFTVYDQPMVMIFMNKAYLSAYEMDELFDHG